MIILMIYTCLTTYLGDGPMWPKQIESAQNCRESWWTNLLYVNNLVLVDKQVREKKQPQNKCAKTKRFRRVKVNLDVVVQPSLQQNLMSYHVILLNYMYAVNR